MTIDGKAFKIQNIKGYSKEVVNLKGHIKEIAKEEEKIGNIQKPKTESTIKGYRTGDFTIVNNEVTSKTNIWDTLKSKIQQIKPLLIQFKQSLSSSTGGKELELIKYQISEIEEKLEKAKNGEIHISVKDGLKLEADLERLNKKKEQLEKNQKSNPFLGMLLSVRKIIPQLGNMSSITIKIKNQIKQMGNGFKQGLGHVLKYTGALVGLRSIYQTLKSSASSWLSSQNSQAQQLSANIEYMKYAMGSVFAPVIEYITNLVYNLMKAVQSLVHAFSEVNIFAKATASSMKNTAGSAKQANKSLAGIHSEINNVSDKDSGNGSGEVNPNIDLSEMDNTPNKIIDAIKNGDWQAIGTMIGNKINTAMKNIPWDKIQNTAKEIGRNIANTLNGFFATTDWTQVGNTFAQGLNTIIYLRNSFIGTFNWRDIGLAIGNSINGLFSNIDFATAGQSLGNGIKGILNIILTALSTINWQSIATQIQTFFDSIDFSEIASTGVQIIINLLNGITQSFPTIVTTAINAVTEFIKGLVQEMPNLIPVAIEMILTIANSILENLPTIIDCAIQIIVAVVEGLVNALPKLIEWLPTIIQSILNIINKSLPQIIEAGIKILIALINGLIECIPQLVEMLPQIINSIVTTLLDNLPLIIDAGIEILIALIEGLVEAIPTLIEMLPEIITTIVATLANNYPKIIEAGGKILISLVSGIISILYKVGEAGWEIIKSIGNVLKELPRKSNSMG